MALDPYRFGTIGVVAFFSISGYLVMTSWSRDPRIVAFAVKRLLRLWPGLALVTVVLTVLAICFQPNRWPEAIEFLRMNLVFVQRGGNYFQSNPIAILNGPTWTIPIEAFCYFALVIAALIFRRSLPLALIAFVVVVGNYTRRLTDASLIEKAQAMGHPTFAPWLVAIFMFGALFSLWPRLQRLWLVFVAIGLAALWAGHSSLALLLAAPPLLVWAGQKSWPFFRHAGRFGDFSYGIYLWAWPVQQSVVVLLGKDASIFAHLFLSMSVTTALAACSWHFVEEKALKQKDQVRPAEPR
jgi:peptidoglycan/LPS O-acetylase OafA/YrhL